MRPSSALLPSAAVAALLASAVAGCNYSTAAGPLPGPSPAPTFKPGVVAEEKIPTANATPYGITSGPDSNVWFSELNGNKLGRVVPGTFPGAGSITECGPIPTASSFPYDVTKVTGSPKVWFDEFNGNKIGNVDPSTCTYAEFTVPTAASNPTGLTADQSGNLWFAESATGVSKITKMTTGGTFTEYTIPLSSADPIAVAVALDGSIWYLDGGRNSVGHLTFPGGIATFVDYGIPTNPAQPAAITLGPDGNMWFTELGITLGVGCQIGKLTVGASPTITEYFLPFPQPFPNGDVCLGITSAGGDIWFPEADTGAIGRVTEGGVVTEYGIPGSGTTAVSVGTGPDGNVWFSDGGIDPNAPGVGTNQIGQVKISLVPALSTIRTYKAKSTTHTLIPWSVHGIKIRP